MKLKDLYFRTSLKYEIEDFFDQGNIFGGNTKERLRRKRQG